MRDPTDPVVAHQFTEGGRVYGLFAKEDIASFTPLGQYTGEVKSDHNDSLNDTSSDQEGSRKVGGQGRGLASRKVSPPARQHSPARDEDTKSSGESRSRNMSPVPHSSERQPVCKGGGVVADDAKSDAESDDYEDMGQYAIKMPKNPRHRGHKNLYTDSKDHANEMSYINDCRGSGQLDNCEYVGFLCNGIPVVVIVTTRVVKADEQIYVDYGEKTYWTPLEIQRREREARMQKKVETWPVTRIEQDEADSDRVLINWTGPVNEEIWEPKSEGKKQREAGRYSQADEEEHNRQTTSDQNLKIALMKPGLEKAGIHFSFVQKYAFQAAEKGHTASDEFKALIKEAEAAMRDTSLSDEERYQGAKPMGRAALELATGLETWLDESQKMYERIANKCTRVQSIKNDISAVGSTVCAAAADKLKRMVVAWEGENRLSDLMERQLITTGRMVSMVILMDYVREFDVTAEIADDYMAFLDELKSMLWERNDWIKSTRDMMKYISDHYLEAKQEGKGGSGRKKTKKRKRRFF